MKEGEEAELQRRKKLTIESEGKFFWKASDELESNRKFRKVQFRHGVDEGASLVEQHKDDDVVDTSSREFLLNQGIGHPRLDFASEFVFHFFRFLAISSLVLVALAVTFVVFSRNTSRSHPRQRQSFTTSG